jgi:hypothetical protein
VTIDWADFFDSLTHTARAYTTYFTITYTLVSTVTSLLPLLGSGFQQRKFLFFSVLELFPASTTRFSQQQFTMTRPQQPSNWLTDLLNSLTSHFFRVRVTLRPALYSQVVRLDPKPLKKVLITSWHGPHRKHRLLLLFTNRFLLTPVVYLLISRLLPSKGLHTTVYGKVHI